MHGIALSVVPVAHAIEIEVTDVVAGNLTHAFTVTLYLSVAVVLSFEHVSSKVDVGCQAILLVLELFPPNSLVPEYTHEQAVYLIFANVVSDFASIWERHLPLAQVLDVSRLNAGTDCPLHTTLHLIIGVFIRKA